MNQPDNVIDCIQGSAEWFEARLGLVTASRISDALGMLKNGKSSQAREDYKMEILIEVLTGSPAEHYVSPAMDFGTQNEPVARSAYEMQTGREVELIGFVLHPRIPRSGASPDGFVGDDGLVEIKVPNTSTHLRYLVAGTVPEDYKPQMLWQMACTERQWCDFVSYDPRLPEEFALLIVRLDRDDKVIAEMEKGVERFISEVNDLAGSLLEHRDSKALQMWRQSEVQA